MRLVDWINSFGAPIIYNLCIYFYKAANIFNMKLKNEVHKILKYFI
jgi:hypothetical protein